MNLCIIRNHLPILAGLMLFAVTATIQAHTNG
jgi:hypothetical protein